MDDKDKPEGAIPEGKRIVIRLEIDADDAERLLKAFADGELDYLGIANVARVQKIETAPEDKQWEMTEHGRRKKPADDVPPLP